MKKIIASLMVALCTLIMAMPASAQLKFGVKGGLNLAKLSTKSEQIKDNSTGFFIGPMAEFTLPVVGLGVDGAFMYSQRGEDDFKQQGIEIPLNLKYTFGLGSTAGLFLAAGPDFFFNFNDMGGLWKEGLKSNKAQVGLNLGAGLKLLGHLQVGLNYTIPLGNSFDLKKTIDGLTTDMKYKTWQVSLAYMF